MIPGKIAIEAAQTTLQSSIAARSFSYKQQPYRTIEGLVSLLPSWSFPGAIKAYALPNKLVEDFQRCFLKPVSNREQIESEYRRVQALQIQLEQERKRVRALLGSWSVMGNQREYLKTWLNIIFVQRLSIQQTLDHLNGVALFLSARKPVSLEVMPFPGETLNANGKALTIPLSLRAYSPLIGRLWRWWFRNKGYYRFLKSKQARFQILTLSFDSPSHDAELIKRTKEDITQELKATQVLVTQSRFYQFTWRAFLKGWKKALARAFNTLEQAEAIWHKRLEAYNNTLLEDLNYQLNQDTFSLKLIEPEKFEYRDDEQINQSLTKLQSLLDKFKTHEQSYSDLSAAGYLLNAGGEELKQTIQNHLKDIFTKEKTLQDIKRLTYKKSAISPLPFAINIKTIHLEDLANDVSFKQLQECEVKINQAQAELTAIDKLGFHNADYFEQWKQCVEKASSDIVTVKHLVFLNLSEQAETIPFSEEKYAAQLYALADEIKAYIQKGLLSPIQVETFELVLDDLFRGVPNDEGEKQSREESIRITLERVREVTETLTVLAQGSHFYDVDTIKSLNDFVCLMYEESEARRICVGQFHDEQLRILERHLAPALKIADAACNKWFAVSTDKANRECIQREQLEEVLCFGLLLQLGDEDLKRQQQIRLNNYLLHQFKYFAGKASLSDRDIDNLLAFETILFELCPELDSKLQVLQEYRENQDWTGYQIYCGQWYALLTQPPIAALSGIGLFAPSQESTSTSEPTVASVVSI